MKKLDLLLVNPGGRAKCYQSLASELTAVEPPIWAGLMATFIRSRGFSVRILDANAEDMGPEETAEAVAEIDPILTAVVAYGHNPSASTQVMPSVREICASVKERNASLNVLLVGGHVATLPQRTLQEEAADFVCEGEGPYTTLGLLEALKSVQPDYGKVRGLWYRDGDAVKSTPPAPLVKGLDQEMPGIAWDLLPVEKYRAHNWHCFGNLRRQPYASLYTTLGCPYHCLFCCIQAPFKSGEGVLGYRENVNSYRLWSPQSVITQIDTLVNQYGIRNIKLADEIFVLNPEHVGAICDLIIERGYDLNLWAYARVDTVRNGMLDRLKRAGFNWLAFGIESASERVLTDAGKGYGREGIFRDLEKVRAAGIYVGANYIFGLPEDDRESMQATLDLALELNAEWANFNCAMAYPGSQLYNIAIQEGWDLPDKWSGYSQYAVDTRPLSTRYVSGAEVLQFRDNAFQVYFGHPRYLERITRTFGLETTTHIREMASQKLQRRYA